MVAELELASVVGDDVLQHVDGTQTNALNLTSLDDRLKVPCEFKAFMETTLGHEFINLGRAVTLQIV